VFVFSSIVLRLLVVLGIDKLLSKIVPLIGPLLLVALKTTNKRKTIEEKTITEVVDENARKKRKTKSEVAIKKKTLSQ
jgi:hypothetical protein